MAKVHGLEQKVKELSVLVDVASQVEGSVELPQVLGALLTSAAAALDLRVCFVCLVRPGSDQATVAASWVRDRSPQLRLKDVPIRVEDHPLVRLGVAEAMPMIIRSLADPRLTDANRRQMMEAGCSSGLVVPAKAGGEVLALLALSWGGERQITADQERLAQALASHAALAIQRARLFSEERETRHWLGLLLDSMPAAVYCLDAQRRIRWVSARARSFSGVGASLREGVHCYDYVDVRDRKGNSICRERCPALECLQRRQTVYLDGIYMAMPHGERVPVTMIESFALSLSGEPLVIGITMDASYRRAADEFRDSVVSIVSHEFRTPLQVIKGFATTLLRQDVEWDTETWQEFLEGIDRETDRLAALVSNLLDLSRLEAGDEMLSERGDCDPLELARAALKRAASLVHDHPVHLRAPSRAKPLFVQTDALERVLANLLENAAKFSQPGQPISLEVKNRQDGVEFHVKDRGRGISPEDQARLFEKFSRGRSAGGVRGAGLGLAICKAFVESNGGRIWLARSAPGKGSDFAFWIPSGRRGAIHRAQVGP